MTSDPKHLLVVEDDENLALMVRDFLTENGFRASIEGDGQRAVDRIGGEEVFDGLLLDIGLPNVDGISICRQVRNSFHGPIIMLTARGDEIDEVVAIEVGADDYISKPIRPRALLARLNMHLRKSHAQKPTSQAKLDVHGLQIDASSRLVRLDEQSIDFDHGGIRLLWLLASHAGEVVERNKIYEELLGVSYDGLDRSIDLRVSRLRKKLGDDPARPQRIKSVRGVGYMLATTS